MANYTELKTQFNKNITAIQNVLNSKKCQLRLKSEGLSLLKNLLDETINKIDTLPKVDNPIYSYIFFNKKKLNKTLNNLKRFGLVNITYIKGSYTNTKTKYININFNKFQNFYIKTLKYFHPKLSLQ